MNSRVYQGHFIRKHFGQNFLKDTHIINNIIKAISPNPNEEIIEIGPGLGALTEPISKYLNTLKVIELDRNLASRLRRNSSIRSKLIIYQKDVMTFNFYHFAPENSHLLRIFGNLPYNISTALIFHLFNYVNAIKDMHFMLQKEVVNRLIAKPNRKSYGRLSIMTQYYFQITPLLEVPSTSFIPSPKVDSIFVRFIPHTEYIHPVSNMRMLNYITAEAFSKRRKTLHNSIGHLFNSEIMESLGIDSHLRAENVTINQYCQLSNWLTDQIRT